MQTTVESTDQHTVRLSIELAADELARDLDRTYRKVGSEVRIPGFRKGKAPRRIIDAHVGREHVLHEFVEEFLPRYYVQALREHELAPIADPEFDLDFDTLQDGESLRFSATVEVRPRLTLEPDRYRGLKVEAPSAEPTDREIGGYLDRLRDRFAELEVVTRAARTGDYVLADVRAYRHDREIAEATRTGFLTEVGSNELAPELDKELEGKRKGEILKFNATLGERFGELAGTEVTFQVLVKEVKAKKLPALDDEFARTASEFDTLDELRSDVRDKLAILKEAESTAAVRDQVLQALVDRVDVDLPDRLVDEETDRRVRSALERVERAGADLDEVLASQGWDQLRFRSDARAHAVRAIKADLALEAVARAEDLRVEPEDLERELETLARESGRAVGEVRRIVERSGQVTALAGDIIRSKALDLLVEAADVTHTDAPAVSERDLDVVEFDLEPSLEQGE